MDKRHSILIVDDDPLHLKLYSWIVNRGGYQATSALVQTKAVDLPGMNKCDLVLMDYNFGGLLTAPEVAHQVKARFPHAPILLLSEQSFMPQDMKNVAAGFVRKGEPEVLLESIAKFLAA